MQAFITKPRGYCAGENMEIDCVDQVLDLRGPPVYVFHEIVHNRHVVDDFPGQLIIRRTQHYPPHAVVVGGMHVRIVLNVPQSIRERLIEGDFAATASSEIGTRRGD